MKALIGAVAKLLRAIFAVPLEFRLASLIGATALSGCAAFTGFPQRVTDPEQDITQLQTKLDANAISECLKSPSLDCRNQITGARMYATDVRFSQFEQSLFRQTREAGFGATLATLGLSTAGAVASGGTSQVLSGLAALVTGGREAFQKEVLAERTVLAIHAAMRTRRAQVALRLRTGLGQPIEQYPLSVALSDLNEYYNAGTVLGALVNITETVGAQAEKAEAKLQERFSFQPDAAAEKLRLALCSNNECTTFNLDAAKRAKACWPQASVPANTFMLDFVLQPAFEKQRTLVSQCMGL